jgi:hypothetical protein
MEAQGPLNYAISAISGRYRGFPLAAKTRYNSGSATCKSVGLVLFSRVWLFEPKRAIGWAKFRAYMQQARP